MNTGQKCGETAGREKPQGGNRPTKTNEKKKRDESKGFSREKKKRKGKGIKTRV